MKLQPGEFSQKLCALAKTIPPGRVTTYASLVIAAGGAPILAQMVTSILDKDPEQDKIPYHRIVYSDGRVWLFEDPVRRQERLNLYRLEGIELDSKNKIINFEKIFYLPSKEPILTQS